MEDDDPQRATVGASYTARCATNGSIPEMGRKKAENEMIRSIYSKRKQKVVLKPENEGQETY